MPNRIQQLFEQKKQNILTIYYTAGIPNLSDTLPILQALAASGTDIVEIGIPFSDPIADGETIQQSNQTALQNGMTLALLLEQLADFRESIQIPVLLMGYLNPVIQFGVEAFCARCAEIGIDGVILPDMPLYEYESEYQAIFERYGLANVFLITPQTAVERIRKIDALSHAFIYAVSSASTTGKTVGLSQEQVEYFERIKALNLKNPWQIGFGIARQTDFLTACRYANGAIIGSAFIKEIAQSVDLQEDITKFVKSISPLLTEY
jgi:tryptophan synthase alpha chain